MQRVRRGDGRKIKKERQGMRYAVLFLVLLCGLCMYLAYRLGNSRGRMDCEGAQILEKDRYEQKIHRIQTDISRIVITTNTDDIRRLLHENYTIAD